MLFLILNGAMKRNSFYYDNDFFKTCICRITARSSNIFQVDCVFDLCVRSKNVIFRKLL